MNGSQISGIFCTQVFSVACVAGFERGRELKEGEPRSLEIILLPLNLPIPSPFCVCHAGQFLGDSYITYLPTKKTEGRKYHSLKK